MPILDSLSYNPNSETVYAAQTTHMLDCLFAFRENTDFMIMADWDDIVVTPSQKPIPLVLDDFVANHPSVGSFYLQRVFAFIPTLGNSNSQEIRSILKIIFYYICYARKINNEIEIFEISLISNYFIHISN
jgi:hypothetical protein